ncbi:hypothetical protein Nepgr_025309 [Nepenthes gracilis]|uniref:Transketolase N-terminal domain-containing protein n=1 Tax=Nepenthes gracilis TaxID=150966 RepID=A0AAD3T7J5_NEPGR|nr:hypothetical protein Nepgr_025309 [Nepenthes gracilis]
MLNFERSSVQFPPRSLDSTPIFTPPVTEPSTRPAHASVGMPINTLKRLDEVVASGVESLSSIESLQNVMGLLANMLQAIDPKNRMAVKDRVIVDRCRVNQTTLLQLLTTTADEGILALGLELKDALQCALAKPDANRLVLLASHGCMLQCAFLDLVGGDSVQEEDLKSFCQWRNRTPGHRDKVEIPESAVTPGPLG